MTYEETKLRKLARMPVLRIFNALGMIAWHKDIHGEAQQRLRMIHPFSWVWLVSMTVFGIFAQGIPETYRDMRDTWRHEMVWF